jgi:hypothetical protein
MWWSDLDSPSDLHFNRPSGSLSESLRLRFRSGWESCFSTLECRIVTSNLKCYRFLIARSKYHFDFLADFSRRAFFESEWYMSNWKLWTSVTDFCGVRPFFYSLVCSFRFGLDGLWDCRSFGLSLLQVGVVWSWFKFTKSDSPYREFSKFFLNRFSLLNTGIWLSETSNATSWCSYSESVDWSNFWDNKFYHRLQENCSKCKSWWPQ